LRKVFEGEENTSPLASTIPPTSQEGRNSNEEKFQKS
jgi:hypothetical protein